MYANVLPNLIMVLFFIHTKVEFRKGLYFEAIQKIMNNINFCLQSPGQNLDDASFASPLPATRKPSPVQSKVS